jgi:hypothetical protein
VFGIVRAEEDEDEDNNGPIQFTDESGNELKVEWTKSTSSAGEDEPDIQITLPAASANEGDVALPDDAPTLSLMKMAEEIKALEQQQQGPVDESDPEIVELRKLVEVSDRLEKGEVIDSSWSLAAELGGADVRQRLEQLQQKVEGMSAEEKEQEEKRLVALIMQTSQTQRRCGLEKNEGRAGVDDSVRGYIEELGELASCIKTMTLPQLTELMVRLQAA